MVVDRSGAAIDRNRESAPGLLDSVSPRSLSPMLLSSSLLSSLGEIEGSPVPPERLHNRTIRTAQPREWRYLVDSFCFAYDQNQSGAKRQR